MSGPLYYMGWAVAAPLFVLFLWAAAFNLLVYATAAIRPWRKSGRRLPSVVPLVGGLSGAVALVLCPVRSVPRYAWLPLVLDVGCLPSLILFVVGFAVGFIRKDEAQKIWWGR